MTDDDRPFTIATAAEYLDCSERYVRILCRTGKLAHFRLGKLIRIPQSAMRELQEGARKQRSDKVVKLKDRAVPVPRPIE